MEASIKLVLKTEKMKNAETVVARLNRVIEAEVLSIEPYRKGGMIVELRKGLKGANWGEFVVASLALAQSFGRSWIVTGEIHEELDMTSTEFSVSGIEWAHVQMG